MSSNAKAVESRGRFLERIEGGASETSVVDERLVALTQPMGAAAEQYRNLSNLKIGSGGAHRNADGQTEASERNVVIDCSSAGQASRFPPGWPSVSRPGPALL